MVDLSGFDANTVEPSTGFEPIPPGKYLAVITESSMKQTKSGEGSFLELAFQIIEGEYKNRTLWARLNLDNPNPVAVKIAQAELSAVCRSTGILVPRDSVELHDLPLIITVKLKKRDDNGELTNVISGYSKKEIQSDRPAQTGMKTPPWRR